MSHDAEDSWNNYPAVMEIIQKDENRIWKMRDMLKLSHGWFGYSTRGDHCLVTSANYLGLTNSERDLISEVLKEQFGWTKQWAEWNDRRRTKKKDVLLVLEKAAIKLDEQGWDNSEVMPNRTVQALSIPPFSYSSKA